MDSPDKHGARWAESEVAQLNALIAERKSHDMIAAALGRTTKAVTGKINALRSADRERMGVGRKRQQRRLSGAAFFLS